VWGIQDAEHAETAPHALHLVITQLACSLVGQTQKVTLTPGTRAYQAYGCEAAMESFRCSYGLNPAYRDKLAAGALQVVGVGPAGDAMIVELGDHRFFLATLFVPQLSSIAEQPHPLIVAYLRAALLFQASRISLRQ
jgi:CTP synthase (UTP-ammonia lyase)